MAHQGDIIENRVTGERVTFLQTSKDTSGELLQLDWTLKPNGFLPGAHTHLHQEERESISSEWALAAAMSCPWAQKGANPRSVLASLRSLRSSVSAPPRPSVVPPQPVTVSPWSGAARPGAASGLVLPSGCISAAWGRINFVSKGVHEKANPPRGGGAKPTGLCEGEAAGLPKGGPY